MINIMIPRDKYWKDAGHYPNLDSKANGRIIPDLFGEKTNITPVCVDTTTLRYKIANCDIRAIFSIDEVRANNRVLTVIDDYTENLADGEITLKGTPKLEPNTSYYFAIEGDWVINGADWVQFYGWDAAYADGNAYEIDGGDVWSALTEDLTFVIYGKNTIGSTEEQKVWFQYDTTFAPVKLMDHADRTKIAMKFKTVNDGQSFFVTKIIVGGKKNAAFPAGKEMYMTLYSDLGITQVGIKSTARSCDFVATTNNNIRFSFPQIEAISEILVDAKGYVDDGLVNLMDNGSDILKFIINHRLNMADATLDLAAFAAFKVAHAEPIAIYMDREIQFNQFLEKLEATLLFKFLPKLRPPLDGKHAPIHYVAAPGEAPHIQEEDFLPGFSCERRLSSVKQKFQVLYGRDPTTNEYLVKEVESDIAKFFYRNEETLRISTYLKDAADATNLLNSYKALLEYPERWAHFPVRNYGLDQIPTEKAKLTRARGDNTGGSFAAVLFRIMRLEKAISDGVVTFDAQLDSQTY